MIKRALISLGLSIALTIVTVLILVFTHIINILLIPLKRIRGTIDYEGESNGQENLAITEGIIMPAIFVICFIVVFLIVQKRHKRRIQKKEPSNTIRN